MHTKKKSEDEDLENWLNGEKKSKKKIPKERKAKTPTIENSANNSEGWDDWEAPQENSTKTPKATVKSDGWEDGWGEEGW